MAYSQNSSHTAGACCLWVVPLVVACLATAVASLAYTRVGNLSNRPCEILAETDSVSLSVAVGALHFPTRSIVVVSAFGALWKVTHIRKFITSLSDVYFFQTFNRCNTIVETFYSHLGHSGQKSLNLRFEFLAICR